MTEQDEKKVTYKNINKSIKNITIKENIILKKKRKPLISNKKNIYIIINGKHCIEKKAIKKQTTIEKNLKKNAN